MLNLPVREFGIGVKSGKNSSSIGNVWPGGDVIVIYGCSAEAFELLCQYNALDHLCHVCV
jgi:hypothetical protein